MVIKPRVRGFMCITSHPIGCEANVQSQIDYVTQQGTIEDGPKKVLVIGASTGYGLASRITAAFASQADTLGLFFEKKVPKKSLAPRVGITLQPFIKPQKPKAYTLKVLMVMHFLMP